MNDLGRFMQKLFEDNKYPDILIPGHDYYDCALILLKHFVNNPESLSNQMKLFRMDYSNDNAHFNDEIGIIKKRSNNIEKIAREILKRVSL